MVKLRPRFDTPIGAITIISHLKQFERSRARAAVPSCSPAS
jgi:hypothetical protein